jgi:hypothetical protein
MPISAEYPALIARRRGPDDFGPEGFGPKLSTNRAATGRNVAISVSPVGSELVPRAAQTAATVARCLRPIEWASRAARGYLPPGSSRCSSAVGASLLCDGSGSSTARWMPIIGPTIQIVNISKIATVTAESAALKK